MTCPVASSLLRGWFLWPKLSWVARRIYLNEVRPFTRDPAMFRVLAVLSMLSVGCGLVLTDKTQPAVNASKDGTVALAAEETAAGDDENNKEELAQIAKQDKEVIVESEADRKYFEETAKDEKEGANDDEEELPESSAEIAAEEKVAAAEETADSDEMMDTAEDEANAADMGDEAEAPKPKSAPASPKAAPKTSK